MADAIQTDPTSAPSQYSSIQLALYPQQPTLTTPLSVLMHHRASATLPRCEQHATVAAVVFDIFESADQVGYAAEASEAADDEGPGAERGCGSVYIYICEER